MSGFTLKFAMLRANVPFVDLRLLVFSCLGVGGMVLGVCGMGLGEGERE